MNRQPFREYAMSSSASNDLKAVETVVWTYLDGLYEGDVKKIGAAFHEVSHLYSVGEGGAVNDLPRAKWLEMVAGRKSPKANGLSRTDRIVSIDFAGPESAMVKVECSVHPRYFTDYLSLLKLKDGWRIVAKSFRTDMRE